MLPRDGIVTVHNLNAKLLSLGTVERVRVGRTFSFSAQLIYKTWRVCWLELDAQLLVGSGESGRTFSFQPNSLHTPYTSTLVTTLRCNSLRYTNGTLNVINCVDESSFISIMLVEQSIAMLQIG